MTDQELFGKVARHLLKQDEKCRAGGCCRYRNSRGLACAIGALIPDEKYKNVFEGTALCAGDKRIVREIMKAAGLEHRQRPLAIDLQATGRTGPRSTSRAKACG